MSASRLEASDPSLKSVLMFGMIAGQDPAAMRPMVADELWHFTDDELLVGYQAAQAMSNVLRLERTRRCIVRACRNWQTEGS
jgi:hypothetical protein